MKNVVFIIVDSLAFDYVGTRFNTVSTTPFLDKMRDESVFANNLYSQGPYTEAGTKALLCGVDVLDDQGYMYRFDKSKYFITDIFKANGFETHAILYPTSVLSNKTLANIDHMHYTSGFLFDVLWSQKLLYYAGLYDKHELTNSEYKDVEDLIRLIFEAWLDFLSVDEHPDSYDLISSMISEYPWKEYKRIIVSESKAFNENPIQYINTLFEQKDKHTLNSLSKVDFGKMIQNKAIDEAFNRNLDFVQLFKKKQSVLNRKNNRIPHGTFLKSIKRLYTEGLSKYTIGEYLYKIQLMKRWKDIETMRHSGGFKPLVSAHSQFEKITEILSQETNKPKFIISHVEEPHYFTTYISYDINDVDLIDSEIKYAKSFINTTTEDYKGLLSYQLSIRYIDKELEALVTRLDEQKILQDTMVVVVADHGSSYNCEPFRSRMVNNFHSENYHIPLYIFDGIHSTQVDNLCSSKDVIPTILDCLGIDKPDGLTGQSLLEYEDKQGVTIEYMGPGCPDMRRRPVWLAVRNKKYLVSYRGRLVDGFSESNISEIYDISEDKEELHNRRGLRNAEIEKLINYMKYRFEEIYENNKDWLAR